MFGTVLLLPPLAFALGALLALLAWPQIRQQGRAGWYGVLGPGLGAWFAGIGAYFFFQFSDWMFSYLFEARLAPLGWLYPVFALVVVGAGAAGSLLGSEAVLAGNLRRAVVIPAVGLAYLAGLIAMTREQILHAGSTLEFRQEIAPPTQDVPLFQVALTGAGVLAAVPTVVLMLIVAVDAWRTVRGRAAPRPSGSAAPN